MSESGDRVAPPAPGFRRTLLRVLVIQVLALLALWWLQARYGQ